MTWPAYLVLGFVTLQRLGELVLAERVAERRIRQVDVGREFRDRRLLEHEFRLPQQALALRVVLQRHVAARLADQAAHLQRGQVARDALQGADVLAMRRRANDSAAQSEEIQCGA